MIKWIIIIIILINLLLLFNNFFFNLFFFDFFQSFLFIIFINCLCNFFFLISCDFQHSIAVVTNNSADQLPCLLFITICLFSFSHTQFFNISFLHLLNFNSSNDLLQIDCVFVECHHLSTESKCTSNASMHPSWCFFSTKITDCVHVDHSIDICCKSSFLIAPLNLHLCACFIHSNFSDAFTCLTIPDTNLVISISNKHVIIFLTPIDRSDWCFMSFINLNWSSDFSDIHHHNWSLFTLTNSNETCLFCWDPMSSKIFISIMWLNCHNNLLLS